MARLFTNNASTSLSTAIGAGDTSLTVAAGDGATFPVLAGSDTFSVTLFQFVGSSEANWEIILVGARSGDTFSSLTRGTEGTTARAFVAGTPVQLRLTSAAATPLGMMTGNPATSTITVGATIVATAFTGPASQADALSTTTSPVNVSAAVAPTPGQLLVASDPTHAVWGTKLGTLVTLKETVFAGITPTGYSNGVTYTIDGSDYICSFAGNGVVSMKATGLSLVKGTTSGATDSQMKITAGNTGDFLSIVGEGLFRRGSWALWSRMASFDFTGSFIGNCWCGPYVQGPYPKWGFQLRHRCRLINNTPNTTVGGIAFDHWMAGVDQNPNSYPGVSTADVLMAYVRDFNTVDVYYGTWAGAWPTMESMTLMGRVTPFNGSGQNYWMPASTTAPAANLVDIAFGLGSAGNATAGNFELIVDRWRITTWT